jgi:hypothetical protein
MMSPLTFIGNPVLWMELMSRHKVTFTLAPDFAYSLVARKFQTARRIPDLDLSSLQYLGSCAEPIRTATIEQFGKVFMKYNLRNDWFNAGYGLAENVVAACYISGCFLSTPRVEDLGPLVAVGSRETFHPSVVIKIVSPETFEEVEDGTTGEVWISGASVASGYYKKPELTEQTFNAKILHNSSTPFLRTGDLAFFQNDKLFICGRIKDLIIWNGTNFYPQDIEAAVHEVDAVRPGCVAAFSTNDSGEDGHLEVVFEIRNCSRDSAKDVCALVRSRIHDKIGIPPHRLVAIKERSILKTTSGKIQRNATRSALHQGLLDIVFEWNSSAVNETLPSVVGEGRREEEGSICLPHSSRRISPEKRICILGAGPGGLSLAHFLQKRGYSLVDVYEKESIVGGKAKGVWCESRNEYVGSGQYTINSRYTEMLALADEFGIDLLGDDSVFENAFFEHIEDVVERKGVGENPTTSKKLASQSSDGYVALGKACATLPSVGLKGIAEDLCGDFDSFLQSIEIENEDTDILHRVITDVAAPAGYAPTENSVPAVFRLKLMQVCGAEWISVKPDGFRLLCEAIAKKVCKVSGSHVFTSTPIEKIDRTDNHVLIQANGTVREYDYLVITGHLNDVISLMANASEAEKKLASEITTTDYVVTLAMITGMPRTAFVRGNFSPAKTGHVFLVSATHYNKHFSPQEPTLYNIFQYGSDYETGERYSDTFLIRQLKEDINCMGGKIMSIEGQRRWDFFPRPRDLSLRNGFFGRFESLQGSKNTFYAGSTMNYELTETTVRYSRYLAEMYFPALDKSEASYQCNSCKEEMQNDDFTAFMRDFTSFCERRRKKCGFVFDCKDHDGSLCIILTDSQSSMILFDTKRCARKNYLGAIPMNLFRCSLTTNDHAHDTRKQVTMNILQSLLSKEKAQSCTSKLTKQHLVSWSERSSTFDMKARLKVLVADILGELVLVQNKQSLHAIFEGCLSFYYVPKRALHSKQRLLDLLRSSSSIVESACGYPNLTDDDIIEQFGAVLCFAAYAGIAQGLGSTVGELLNNPLILETAKKDDEFLRAVIMESLRLHPPVTFATGELLEDEVIGDIKVKKGTTIKASLYHALRTDENVFPEPSRFNPSRWIGPQAPFFRSAQLANLMFATGFGDASGRGCPAKSSALVIMETAIKTIIQHSSFNARDEIQWEKNIHLQVGSPISLEVVDFELNESLKNSSIYLRGTKECIHKMENLIPRASREAARILSDLTLKDVQESDEFSSIELTSMELVQFRDRLCDSLGFPTQKLSLITLLQAIEDGTVSKATSSILEKLENERDDVSKGFGKYHEVACAILQEIIGESVTSGAELKQLHLSSAQFSRFVSLLCEAMNVPVNSIGPSRLTSLAENQTVSSFVKNIALESQSHPNEQQEWEMGDEEHRNASRNLHKLLWQVIAFPCPFLYLATSLYPVIKLYMLMSRNFGKAGVVFSTPLLAFIYLLTSAILLVVLKWGLLGYVDRDVGHGGVPVWSRQFACRWIFRQCTRYCCSFTPWVRMGDTILLTWLYRFLGCRIGRGSTLSLGCIEDPDLVEIGEYSCLEGTIVTSFIRNQNIYFAGVSIGADCLIKESSYVGPGSQIDDFVTVHIGCSVGPNQHLQANTEWDGKPAKQRQVRKPHARRLSPDLRFFFFWQPLVVFGVWSYWIVVAVLFLATIVPMTASKLGFKVALHIFPLLASATTIFMTLTAIAVKWAFLGQVRPGSWPLGGSFHRRKYLVDTLFDTIHQLGALSWLFASIELLPLFQNLLLRARGTKINLSFIFPVRGINKGFDLVHIVGTNHFFGEFCSILPFETERGFIRANDITVEGRTYVGKVSALLGGTHMMSGSAVAQYSVVRDRVGQGNLVFSTSKLITTSTASEKQVEMKSNLPVQVVSLIVALFNWSIYSANIELLIRTGMVDLILCLDTSLAVIAAIILVIIYVLLTAMLSQLLAQAIFLPNGLQAGFIRIGTLAWCRYAVYSLITAFRREMLLQFIGGTDLETLWYRLQGAKIDEGAYLDGCRIYEPHVVTIGKNCSLDIRSGPGAVCPHDVTLAGVHIVPVAIGSNFTLCTGSTVHGGDKIDDCVTLLPFSAPMKGSTLQAGAWTGYPCEQLSHGTGIWHPASGMNSAELGLSFVDINATLSFDGYIPLEEFSRAEEVLSKEKKWIRFRSWMDFKNEQWVPIKGWTFHDHVKNEPELQASKLLWYVYISYSCGQTIVNFRVNHALGDGYSLRVLVLTILDPIMTKEKFPKPPLGYQLYKSICDRRLKGHEQKHEPFRPAPLLLQVPKVVPIDLPDMSIRDIKALGKLMGGGSVNEVLLMLVSETKRRLGEPHEWLACTFNQRGLNQLDRVDNVSAIIPMYVGDGSLSSIRQYSRIVKVSSMVTYSKFLEFQKKGFPNIAEGDIGGLSNVPFFLEQRSMMGYPMTSVTFHVTRPNLFYFVSKVNTMRGKFVIEEHKKSRGEEIRNIWCSVLDEFGLSPHSTNHSTTSCSNEEEEEDLPRKMMMNNEKADDTSSGSDEDIAVAQ